MWASTTASSSSSSLLPSPFYSPGASPTKQSQQRATSMMASSPPSPRLPLRSSSRRLSSHLSTSPNPTNLPLVGSYSESLLNGRMSTTPSKPFPFEADIGALGCSTGQTPKHLKLDFEARFYPLPESNVSSTSNRSFSSSFAAQRCEPPTPTMSAATTQAPYVGAIDLDSHYNAVLASCLDQASDQMPTVPPFPGYAVPRKGQIQLLIKNTHLKVPAKLFLVPYDLRDMPAGTKTFLRQKVYIEPAPSQASSPVSSRAKRHSLGASTSLFRSDARPKEMLKYAVHLQFAAPPIKTTSSKKQGGKRTDQQALASQSLDSWQSKSTLQPSDEEPKIFLHKAIRVVFAPRAPDPEEKVNTYYETPAGLAAPALPGQEGPEACQRLKEKKYAPYAGPSSEWDALRRRARLARREWKQSKQRRQSEGSGADQSDLSFASMATSEGDAGEVMAGEAVEAAAMAMDIDVEPSGPTIVSGFEPNSDPNGERWHEQMAEDDDGREEGTGAPADRWNIFARPRHAEEQRTTMPSSQAAVWPPRGPQYALQRQRSQTITPPTNYAQNGRASPVAIALPQQRTARSLEAASAAAAQTVSSSSSSAAAAATRAVSPAPAHMPFPPPSLTTSTAALEPIITTESARAVTSPPPSPYYQQHHHHTRNGRGEPANRFSYFLPGSQHSSGSLPRAHSPAAAPSAPARNRPSTSLQPLSSPSSSWAPGQGDSTINLRGDEDEDDAGRSAQPYGEMGDVAMPSAEDVDDNDSAQLLQSWHSQLRRSHARAVSQATTASDGNGGSAGRGSPALLMRGNGSDTAAPDQQPRR